MANLGVDLSVWNIINNYKALKNTVIDGKRVKFAMLRYSFGMSKDARFDRHYDGCKQAGVYVGVYHWIRAATLPAARVEVDWLIKSLTADGVKLDYPVALDFEDSKLFALNLDKAHYTALVRVFIRALKKAGYRVLLYTNPDTLRNRLYPEILTECDLWLAHWVKNPANYCQSMWQMGCKPLDCAGGNMVDIDWCYKSYAHDKEV